MTACWSRIGVHGDRSCGELRQHVHCRNCSVYTAAARELLERDATAADIVASTRYLAATQAAAEENNLSVLVFRIGAEWLALPTTVVKEVAELRAVHPLPHRRGGAVLGVANVRGQLLVCVALGPVLGLDTAPVVRPSTTTRLLVIRRDDVRVVCPADEVDGVHRVDTRQLREAPATVAHADRRHTTHVWSRPGGTVGVLDDAALFRTLKRSLA